LEFAGILAGSGGFSYVACGLVLGGSGWSCPKTATSSSMSAYFGPSMVLKIFGQDHPEPPPKLGSYRFGTLRHNGVSMGKIAFQKF
jgi:hypothetical protein